MRQACCKLASSFSAFLANFASEFGELFFRHDLWNAELSSKARIRNIFRFFFGKFLCIDSVRVLIDYGPALKMETEFARIPENQFAKSQREA